LTINWPNDAVSDYSRPLINDGNVDALVTLTPTPGTLPYYLVSGPGGVPITALTLSPGLNTLNAEYGAWPRTTKCDTQTRTTDNGFGNLVVQVAPTQPVGIPAGPTAANTGVCGDPGNAGAYLSAPAPGNHEQWGQTLTLDGSLLVAAGVSPCQPGQGCQTAASPGASQHHCICDTTSCGNVGAGLGGCCLGYDQGICDLYATQTPAVCGIGGNSCAACPIGNETCQSGVCACPSTTPYLCGGTCVIEDNAHCGGCTSCNTATTGLTCQNHVCQCPNPADKVMCPLSTDGGPAVYACTTESPTACGPSCQNCTVTVGANALCVNHACQCADNKILCGGNNPPTGCQTESDTQCGSTCVNCTTALGVGAHCVNHGCQCINTGDVLCSNAPSPGYTCTAQNDTHCGPSCENCQTEVGPGSTCVSGACTCLGLDCNIVSLGHRCVTEGLLNAGLTTPNTPLNGQMYCGHNASDCQDCTTSTGAGSVCNASHACVCPNLPGPPVTPQVTCSVGGGGVACTAEGDYTCGAGCVNCKSVTPLAINRGPSEYCDIPSGNCVCPTNTCNNAGGCYNGAVDHCGTSCWNCSTFGSAAYCNGTNGGCYCPTNTCWDGVQCYNSATHCGVPCNNCHSGATPTLGPDATCSAGGACTCVTTQPVGSLGVVSCSSGCRDEDDTHCSLSCTNCPTTLGTGATCSTSHACTCGLGGNGNPRISCTGPLRCQTQDNSHCGCAQDDCNDIHPIGSHTCNFVTGLCQP
jgi:hypothetical protein